MRLTDLLSPERVGIRRANGRAHFDKDKAIALLATHVRRARRRHTAKRSSAFSSSAKQLQSTGIGEGVAIPHGALPQLKEQVAALLIVPDGVEFQAIDDAKVSILFGGDRPEACDRRAPQDARARVAAAPQQGVPRTPRRRAFGTERLRADQRRGETEKKGAP